MVDLVDPVGSTQVERDPSPDVFGGTRISTGDPVGVDSAIYQPHRITQRRRDGVGLAGAHNDLDSAAFLTQVRDQIVTQSFHCNFNQARIGTRL